MTIAASRTHRSLAEFVTGSTLIESSGFQTENSPILRTKRTPGVQITLPPMEVSVQTACEQYPPSQSSLDNDINEQQNDECKESVIDHDLESGMAERAS